jgi:uncharacterized RDD family membrane protein YckC
MTIETAGEYERTRDNQAWARWLARGLDAVLITPAVYAIFVAIGIGIELGRLPEEIYIWIDTPYLAAIMEIAVRFVVFCLWEPLFLANTGTTPGKWMMGIRVRTADGAYLGFFQSLWRFVRVWVIGLGASLPLLSLIALLYARAKLIADGVTAWDEPSGFQVFHRGRHPLLWTLFILLVVGVNIGLGILGRMSEGA